MGAGMPNKVRECGNTAPTAIKLRNSENHSSQHLQSTHRPSGHGISTGEMNDILLCIYSKHTALHSYDTMHSYYVSSAVPDDRKAAAQDAV